MYENLDAKKIVQTIDQLERRIRERFGEAGLPKVAHELGKVAADVIECGEYLRRPHVPLRIGIGVLLAGAVAVVGVSAPQLHVKMEIDEISDLMQTVEALLGSLFFLGTGIAFLVTLESRLKRRRALAQVHRLRSLAHIVDMHQLTKDPEQLLGFLPPTESSPVRTMSDVELMRYLDYASELVSLISKVGALVVQDYADAVVLASVDEVENLCTGLSGRIWQKIMMLDQIVSRLRAGAPA